MSITIKEIKTFSDIDLAKEKFKNDLLIQEHILAGNFNRIKSLAVNSITGMIRRNLFRLAGIASFSLIRKFFKRKRQSKK